jgi:hypothetical protein
LLLLTQRLPSLWHVCYDELGTYSNKLLKGYSQVNFCPLYSYRLPSLWHVCYDVLCSMYICKQSFKRSNRLVRYQFKPRRPIAKSISNCTFKGQCHEINTFCVWFSTFLKSFPLPHSTIIITSLKLLSNYENAY